MTKVPSSKVAVYFPGRCALHSYVHFFHSCHSLWTSFCALFSSLLPDQPLTRRSYLTYRCGRMKNPYREPCAVLRWWFLASASRLPFSFNSLNTLIRPYIKIPISQSQAQNNTFHRDGFVSSASPLALSHDVRGKNKKRYGQISFRLGF